jgi:hypothetical protein
MQDRRVPLGTYRGLRFGMVLHPQWRPEVYLEGAITRLETLGESRGPRAMLNAVQRLAKGYGIESERTRQELAIAESQLRGYQARLGQPFPHDEYLAKLTALRDQLKAGLSGLPPEPGSESLPPAELAGRIKALKASYTIEAEPQRISSRQVSAEEPVTARIRRQAQPIPGMPPLLDLSSSTAAQGQVLASEGPHWQTKLAGETPKMATPAGRRY